MIISGGFIDCVLSAAGPNGAGGNYSDYSHHRWTIGSSGQITATSPPGQPIDATWQLISGNGSDTSNMPGYGESWTRTPGSKPAPMGVYIKNNTVVLQRTDSLQSLPNAFMLQSGSQPPQYNEVDEIGLVGLLGPNPALPMTTGLEWSSSLQGSYSSPIVIVHLTIIGRGGIRRSIPFPWNVGLTDTTLSDIHSWFYMIPAGVPASAWWHWTIDF